MDEKKVREAIEDLKELAELLQNKESSAVDSAVEHCNTAIEALEKQLPKKVEYEGGYIDNGFTKYRMAKCPTCDRWYNNNDEVAYCPNCGQKLDWSESKQG